MKKTYIGKVCELHPEFKGERRCSNWKCVQCQRDYLKVWNAGRPRVRTDQQKLVRRLNKSTEQAHNTARKRERYASDPKYRAAYAHRNKRRQRRMHTPPWADLAAITALYTEAKQRGLTVDHEIPLNHPLVCGLHVQFNLQLLTAAQNSAKGNHFEVI